MGTYADFFKDLAFRESSGNHKAVSSLGFLGLYQFTEWAMVDIGWYNNDGNPGISDWKGTWTAKAASFGVRSATDYLDNPTAQNAAMTQWAEKLWSYISYYDLQKYIGATINGILITESGMLAGAHLRGITGLESFLQSNGSIVDRDEYGTPITEYIKLFSGYQTPFGSTGADASPDPTPIAEPMPIPDPAAFPETIPTASPLPIETIDWSHVDTVAPETSLAVRQQNKNFLIFTWTGDDGAQGSGISHFEVKLGNGDWFKTNQTQIKATSNLTSFEVRAVDMQGNVDPSPANWEYWF